MLVSHSKVLAIIFALPAEARPFIRKLGLRRARGSGPPTYESDKVRLVISGVGRQKAADATAYLLEKESAFALCNVGICGSRAKRHAIGTTIYVNRIRDNLTGRSYYPDPVVRHEFPEAGLVTHDEPQVMTSVNPSPDSSLVDMEAAGICQQILPLLPPHRFHFLKIVSDHLDDAKLSACYVEQLVEEAYDGIWEFMENLRSVVASEPIFNEIADFKYNNLAKGLRLTTTQRSHLERLCLHRVSAGDHNLDILDSFENIVSAVKVERNKIFKKICCVLLP